MIHSLPLRLVFNPINLSVHLILLPVLRALAGQVKFGLGCHAELRLLSMIKIGGSSLDS
jgi:hypothetical protein